MGWSKKYKRSIDCSNPKGFSQKAHCAGRKARQAGKNTKSKSINEMNDNLKEIIMEILTEGVDDPGILKCVFMAGGPGSGKSTYTEYLIKHFNITHIYPGGMLRKEVEKGSEIGQQVKSIIDRGEFVPNQIVLDLITKKVEQLPLVFLVKTCRD